MPFATKKKKKRFGLSTPNDKSYKCGRKYKQIFNLRVKENNSSSGRPIMETIKSRDSRDKTNINTYTRSCEKLAPTDQASVENILHQDIQTQEIEIIPPVHECATHPRNETEIIKEYVTDTNIRSAIIDQFVRVFNCPPEKNWTEIIRCVRRNLKLFEHKYYRRIRRTFKSVAMQLTRCHPISPDRKRRRITQKNMIDADSFDAQLIADMIEAGYSYQKCTIALNLKKNQMDLPFVTLSTVYGVANRLDPITRTVKKRKQGSFNPEDKWSIARKGWAKQLLVRLGKLKINNENGEQI